MIERPVDPEIKKAARVIAVRCRHVIQAVLRDEEKADCDHEFTTIAETVITRMVASKRKRRR